MPAILELKGVGGFKDEFSFRFKEDSLSFIEGSNSGGKSSVIQAITAVLSLPIHHEIGAFYEREASKLGLRTESSSMQEGFVNVLSDHAFVLLKYNEKTASLRMARDGDISGSDIANPKFMLAGIISNKSKIARQLRGHDDRHEPDDFRWAVTELSLAKRYEEVSTALDNRIDHLNELKQIANSNLKKTKKLTEKKSDIEQKMETLDSDIGKIKEKYEDVKGEIQKIERLRKRRADRIRIITRQQSELNGYLEKEEVEKKEIQELKTKAKKLREKSKNIDLRELKKAMEKKISSINEEISELKEERSSVDTILNLFVVAQSHVTKGTTQCPLCKKGSLSADEVKKQLKKLEKEKKEVNSKISNLASSIQRQRADYEKFRLKKEKLDSDAKSLIAQAEQIQTEQDLEKSRISTLENKLAEDRSQLEEIEANIDKLTEKIGEGSVEAKRAYEGMEEKHEKLQMELVVIEQKLYDAQVSLLGKSLKPDIALEVLNSWIEWIQRLHGYSKEKSESQKKLASEKFNKTIKQLMERLNFSEFRTIMLNANYRLYIERFDEKKRDYVFQQVRTLSTSEQMSVALILQIALKETYLSDIPFFLIDDILEDFDEERRMEVISYLKEKAKENDWYLICSKLVEGLDEIRVVSEE